MTRRTLLMLLDGGILALVVYLTHQTIFVWFMEYNLFGGSPQLQLGLFLAIIVVILLRLRLENEERAYFSAWWINWPAGLFICLALLSAIWSVSVGATLYRGLLVFFVTVIGAYFGLRFSARNLVNFVAVVIAVFALSSLFLVLLFPDVGIRVYPSSQYMWSGIFWHKNYLGATMALGYTAYLVILFSSSQQYSRLQKSLAASMLVLSSALAVLSNSASGLVLIVVQTGLFALVFCWLTWGHLIPRRVYLWSGGGMVLVFLLIVTNLEFVFGLFNRSSNMTGRVPMWLHLLNAYVSKRPFLGHGFGSFWLQPGIMQKVQIAVGWDTSVRTADNGYLDVLLGLGGLGLGLLLVLLATAFWRAIRSALQGHDFISFFPFFMLIHILFINISLSYFFENENFIWFLLVIILFMPALYRRESRPVPV